MPLKLQEYRSYRSLTLQENHPKINPRMQTQLWRKLEHQRSNTGTPKSMANVVFSPTPGIFGMHSSQLPAGFCDQNAEEGPVIVDMDKGTIQINKYVEDSPMPAWMKSRIRKFQMDYYLISKTKYTPQVFSEAGFPDGKSPVSKILNPNSEQ